MPPEVGWSEGLEASGELFQGEVKEEVETMKPKPNPTQNLGRGREALPFLLEDHSRRETSSVRVTGRCLHFGG